MEWLINLGYLGLFIGTAMAGSVIPVSSDVFMVAMLLAGGNPWICLVVASVAYAAGGYSSYGLGWMGKWEWLERFFNIKQEKLEKQKAIIDKYGVWVALFKWIPVVGTLNIITLGFYKVQPKFTAILLLVGSFIRFIVWVILYLLFSDDVIGFFTR